jgi:triphosphoribosyl-dephospho-CoA synthase
MCVIDRHASASCSPDIPLRNFSPRWIPTSPWPTLRKLARSLALGAGWELDLTPKPGLVDRDDNGSHPDLTYAQMRASVCLLPEYYADLMERLRAGSPLASCVEAGRLAEARMLARVGSNTHRGFIFLSGLTLVGTHRAQGVRGRLGSAMADAAKEFFRAAPMGNSHGSRASRAFGVGGIRREAEVGLPSVFEAAWPRYANSLQRDGNRTRAGYYAMASLMQRLEDTTTLHRCGPAGLDHVRADGRELQALLDEGSDPRAFLRLRNAAYRRVGLTMGGVADCLALTMALQHCFDGEPAPRRLVPASERPGAAADR